MTIPRATAPGQAPHLVLVIGVHRSGTSLLTAGLAAIGCRLGEFEDTPLPENPKGFFEHPKVRQFNDRLLAARGVAWDNWGYDAVADGVAELVAEREAAAALLRGLFAGPGPHVLKDPRIATLLPFWEAVLRDLGWRVTRVLLLRDPAEVAESQRRRAARNPDFHGLLGDRASASALWSVTMHGVLASLAEDGALLVSHGALYDRTEAVLAACAERLGLAPPPGAIARFATDFLDPALRHGLPEPAPVEPGWPALAAALHAALRPADTPRHLSGAEARAILAGQDQLKGLLPFLGAMRHGIAHARLAAARSAGRLATMRRALWALASAAVQGAGPARIGQLISELGKLLEELPGEVPLMVVRARLLEKSGERDAAEAVWRALATSRQTRVLGLRELAAMLRRAGRTAQAEAVEAELGPQAPGTQPR